LPSAHLNFFAAFKIKQQATIKVKVQFFYPPACFMMRLRLAHKPLYHQAFPPSALSDFKIQRLIAGKKHFSVIALRFQIGVFR